MSRSQTDPVRNPATYRWLRLLLNGRGDNRQSGITWGQRLGRPECPYMRRWVLNWGTGSLRVHHWYASDDDRALHDHPWPFVTLVVRGGYTDVSTDDPRVVGFIEDRGVYQGIRLDHLGPGSVRVRPALHAHTVRVDPGGCWTVMLTARAARDWGFYTEQGWMRMRRFFRTYGHHPCD